MTFSADRYDSLLQKAKILEAELDAILLDCTKFGMQTPRTPYIQGIPPPSSPRPLAPSPRVYRPVSQQDDISPPHCGLGRDESPRSRTSLGRERVDTRHLIRD